MKYILTNNNTWLNLIITSTKTIKLNYRKLFYKILQDIAEILTKHPLF